MQVQDPTGGVVLAADMDDVRLAKVADHYCKVIGAVIRKKYPKILWHVTVNPHMGMAGIRIPAVSMRHGVTIHLSRLVHELEERAIAAAGGMLADWNINPLTGDFSHLLADLNIRGEHRLAGKQGGL